ncbi:hypothetical protein BDM02DRAFT_3189966 [Thelephora ganbajun]|uniref:Uncharacterized protein n=1 Tax=Thelephora ganbajun TaxID=370292 RepID=A0ACB6Z7M7_THEGA|nr:hypothetical protein BDM02DRAFT_3189966 [Thelephora ganbajun]
MANLFRALGRRAESLIRKTTDEETVVGVVEQPIDLTPISAAIHHGCMGLPQELIDSVLTREEKSRYPRQDYHDVELRFLSYTGERGLLRYTRQVHVHMGHTFTPGILLPHLSHFRSLDRVHSLTIEAYDAVTWANYSKPFFVHFYPTLTSLTLHRPLNHYRYVLQFALQFPNLENLTIEWLENHEWIQPDMEIPAIVDKPPPLRGHLRLADIYAVVQ